MKPLVALLLAACAATPAAPRIETPPHPLPEDPRWLVFPAQGDHADPPHVVFVAGDQEYRSEQSLPMLARLFATRHGMHTTVLFSLDGEGRVNPTLPIKWEEDTATHDIPGLEHLTEADLVVWFTRLVTLPEEQLAHLYKYLDSDRPLMAMRTGNHGFIGWDYRVGDRRVSFGDEILGGAFRGHHGRWHADSTLATPVPEHADHPILRGIETVWGPTDVYRTFPEGESLPEGCTPLLMGQPLMARERTDPPNPDLIPLPVAWTKSFTGNGGVPKRVFHTTMGSAKDCQDAGMRHLLLNASWWCLGREARIDPEADVTIVGDYAPLASGFNHAKLGVVPRLPAECR